MKSTRKAFDFVKISDLPPKPRKSGVIEIRGPYYAPMTIGYLMDLLEMWGDYIDGFKFAGGSMRLLSVDIVKRILKVCHDHDVYVSTGGFVERIIVQGPGRRRQISRGMQVVRIRRCGNLKRTRLNTLG